MEMFLNGNLAAEFEPFCIRDYTAEVRKTDWKKTFPFKLSSDNEAYNRRAHMIYASLLGNNDHLANYTPEIIQVPIPYEPEVQAVVDDQPQDAVIDDHDAVNEVNDDTRFLANLRHLSDVDKEHDGLGDADVSEPDNHSTDDIDNITLNTFIQKKKGKQVISTKRRSPQVIKPKLGWVKRSKPAYIESSRNDPEFGSTRRRYLGKNKVGELAIKWNHKRKRSPRFLLGGPSNVSTLLEASGSVGKRMKVSCRPSAKEKMAALSLLSLQNDGNVAP